jgi:hypothetical protein
VRVGINWPAGALLLWVSTVAAGADVDGDPSIAAPPVYEDRLIDGGNLPADVSVGLESQRNASGWPRAFRVQAVTSRVTRNDVNADETGVQLGGMLDTPNYGALSLEANLRTSTGYGDSSGNLLSLHQIGLPMNGGWLVNNSLGATNAPAVDLARSQYRFFVPVILSNGATTEWRNQDRRLQLQASVGQPGLLTGIYVPTFEDLGGRQASAGMQWGDGDGWSAALQATDVADVRFGLGRPDAAAEISSQAWFGAIGWGTPGMHVQLNLVESATDDQSGQAGGWIDAAIRQGRTQHNFGAFHLEPCLVWGNLSLTSNLEGGYYRAAFQNRQWTLDGGVDYVSPVSGGSDSTIFGTGYGRYQVSGRLGIGGGMNVRQGAADAWSTFGFVDNANRLGIGRAQLEYATDDFRDNTQLTLNQTWNTPPGTRLGSSLFLGREQIADVSANRIGVAMNGGGDIRSNLAFDVDARWDTSDGQSSYDNVLASAALNWAFATGWTMGANYYISRNSWRTPFEVTSPIPGFPSGVAQRSDDEGYFVNVRYQWQAGSRTSTLGGGSSRGSGSVSGVLFLDENDNGRFDAGEAGAPNVVVLLNGRFAARTNTQGRFEFQAVAAGSHVLTVVQDNLPLPWTVPADGRTSISVGVRDQTFVALAARRLR